MLFKPLLPSRSAIFMNLDGAEANIDFVVKHNHVLNRNFIIIEKRAGGVRLSCS